MTCVFQNNDLRFLRIMAQKVNLCQYKKLPHELKMELSDAHIRFERSAELPDWDSEREKRLRDILLEMGNVLVSKAKVDEKKASLRILHEGISRI